MWIQPHVPQWKINKSQMVQQIINKYLDNMYYLSLLQITLDDDN